MAGCARATSVARLSSGFINFDYFLSRLDSFIACPFFPIISFQHSFTSEVMRRFRLLASAADADSLVLPSSGSSEFASHNRKIRARSHTLPLNTKMPRRCWFRRGNIWTKKAMGRSFRTVKKQHADFHSYCLAPSESRPSGIEKWMSKLNGKTVRWNVANVSPRSRCMARRRVVRRQNTAAWRFS